MALNPSADGQARSLGPIRQVALDIPEVSDVFDRVRNILGDDWSHDDMRKALARSSKENGWDEPGMEAYDHYDRTP